MKIFGFPTDRMGGLKISNYYSYNYDYFDMEPHRHFSAEIMYCEHGKCEINVNNVSFSLKKNQFVIIASNVVHSLYVKRNTRCKIINIEFSPCEETSHFISDIIHCPEAKALLLSIFDYAVMYDSTNEVLRILKKTIAELTSKQYLILSEIALLSCFSGLFIEIIRNHSVEQTAARHTVQQILEFTAKEFSSGISTKEVAAYCNQNPIYLERVFKKTTGESITEHIINLRLDNACKLIAGTTIPLTDIAVQSGFNSRQNFYEAFKKRLNTTPKLYRQSVAKELESNYLQTPFIKKYK